MQIGSLTIPPLLVALLGLLVVFGILSFFRRVTHDGKWEMGTHSRHAWTDKCTGTSFASTRRVLMPNELGSRRAKFGKSTWSWPITVVVLGLIGLALHAFGAF